MEDFRYIECMVSAYAAEDFGTSASEVVYLGPFRVFLFLFE